MLIVYFHCSGHTRSMMPLVTRQLALPTLTMTQINDFDEPSSQLMSLDLALSLPNRAVVKALGGPYEPSLDYRREIVGHLAALKRCQFCFCEKDSQGHPSNIMKWETLWCSDCFTAHSICESPCDNTGN